MKITSLDQLDLSANYTYFDYLQWQFQERVELFKGKIFKMSPAPASGHQRISANISFELQRFLEYSTCQVFYAPFDVRLEPHQDNKLITTVVQPDVCVICDASKIDEKGCVGPPDLVVEILSPGNSKKEMKQKFDLYEEAGVLEYWIVLPSEETIWLYVLENGSYVNHRPLIIDDSLQSNTIAGFSVPMIKIFK
jgi:Uma2 family endonuclease